MFRYRDTKGFERRLINEAALLAAIRAGIVLPGTPLAEGIDGPWGVAGRHPAFARAGESRGFLGVVRALRESRLGSHRRVVVVALVAGVLLAAGGFTLDHLRAQRIAEQRLEYADAMLGLALGRQPAPELVARAVGAPLVDDASLRSIWVRFQVARAIALSADSAQTAFAIRGFLPPEGWMSDDYVRNARSFGAVGAHWAGYLAFDSAWSDDAEKLLLRETGRRAAEAGLTERETFELIDPEQPGLSAVGWDLELRRQFAAEASRLHTTLVESRGNAFVSDGEWWFADTRTQRAYAQHRANLQRIASALQQNAARRAAAYGLTARSGVVPDAVAGMRPAGS